MPISSHDPKTPDHFNGKDALHHVIEAQAQGIVLASEVHGTEIPGHLSAGCDAARETGVLLPALWLLLSYQNLSFFENTAFLLIFSFGWMLWKGGRGAWLGWFRLERLHRVLAQEKWEIEHHSQQERDELRVLYAAKGFEGKLLEDVLDVLMADNDRLLKVMIEEELGLSLGTTEHPLKQGIGAVFGVFIASVICCSLHFIWPDSGIFLGALLTIIISSAFTAYLAENESIPAIIWNLGLAGIAIGSIYFLLEWYNFHLVL